MKLNHFVSLLSLISGAFLLASPCGAQPLVYETTQANAIARAKAEGKMILTDFGRPNCSDCVGMQTNFAKLSPPLRQWILASCVLWTANIDTSTEWSPYASGLDSFALPLMCFVDPAKPGTYSLRLTGLIPANTFLTFFLQDEAKKNLPLIVTNLPGVPLTDASFVVKGMARSNAAFSGSISNAAVTAVMWRLNGTGSFTPATGTTVWSAPVTLPPGTNTFESYVQYAGGANSWTNRVTLINLGSGGTNQPQTITFNPLSDQTYGVAPITLTATASSGLPVTFTVTSGPANVSGNVLTITGAGTVTVTADQAGNATYSAAPSVARTFTVNKATPTVNTWPTASAITNGQTLSFSTLSGGSASVSGIFAFTTPGTVPSVGTYNASVTFTPTDINNYNTVVGSVNVAVAQTPGDVNGDNKVDQLDLQVVLANFGTNKVDRAVVENLLGHYHPPTTTFFRVEFTTNLVSRTWSNFSQFTLYGFLATNAPQGFYRLAAP